MAVLGTLCALVMLFSFLMSKTVATTVEVTVPVHPVSVGGILAIQCQISDMEDGNTVKIFRVIDGQTEEITSELRYLSHSLDHRVFITKRTMPGGILVYFMTILDVSVHDKAKYLCKVYTLFEEEYVKVAEDSIHVEIYSLPDKIYPVCESTPEEVENRNEGIQLNLKCISAKGTPAVTLRWIDNSNQEIYSRSKTIDDTVSSEITQRTTGVRDGTVFVCEMTSPGFKDFKRTCKIGPITMKRSTDVKNTDMLKPIVTNPPTKHKTLIPNDCNSECPKHNKYTILYLSVATVGAALLCIVFLITTIIMCCKYHNVSREAKDTQRGNIICSDGSEPVYVSLQRRMEPPPPERRSIYKESDRSSVYMSVEDPNNPGNKVLMPKEVFEEFYNSLSLKKPDKNRSVVGV